MGDFGDAERRILAFMTEGTEFVFQDKKYKVIFSGKPTCHKGEPKTDIYILANTSMGAGQPPAPIRPCVATAEGHTALLANIP